VKVVPFRRPLATCAFLALACATVLPAARGARAEDAPATPASAQPDSVPATPAPAPAVAPAPAAAPAVAADSKPAVQGKTKKVKKPREPKVKKPKTKRPPPQSAWDGGATWISLRAGYAKAAYRHAGNGQGGAGFGANHMLSRRWSIGGYAEYDVLGKFGAAYESEATFTLELDRQFSLGSAFHSYVGFGGGTYYHKNARTGDGLSDPRGGGYLALGGNTEVTPHQLLGLDVRAAVVKGKNDRVDPVFGVEKASTFHWSVKLNWSIVNF